MIIIDKQFVQKIDTTMRFCVAIICLCFASQLFAQKDTTNVKSKRQFGIAAHTSLTRYSIGVANSLVFTINRKKHQFEFGPKYITNASVKAVSQMGLESNYRYYPNGISSKCDLFFLVNADFYFLKAKVKNVYPNYPEVTARTNYLTLNTGFGIQVHLWKGFYLASHVAGGLMLESYLQKGGSNSYGQNLYYDTKRWKLGYIGEVNLGFRFN